MNSEQRYRQEYGLTAAARTEAQERRKQATFKPVTWRDAVATIIFGVIVVSFALVFGSAIALVMIGVGGR